MYYKNKKGKLIPLTISQHAKERIKERLEKLGKPLPENLESFIAEQFFHAQKIKKLSDWYKKRSKRYGKDTLFFQNNEFTFVVQNCSIRTVEISGKGLRHLNKNPIGAS